MARFHGASEAMKDEETRRTIFGKFMASTYPEKSTRDTGAFLDWLARERRASVLTVAAYGRDLSAFLGFLTGHLGAEPDLADPPSDGHMTGLALIALRKAGVPASDSRIQRGVTWILTNQRA